MVRASAVAVRPRRVEGEGDCRRWLPDTQLCSSLEKPEDLEPDEEESALPLTLDIEDVARIGRGYDEPPLHQIVPLP